MTERKMCFYCGRWYDLETMTALFEEQEEQIWYCEDCRPAVKNNLSKLPYSHLFKRGGGKGSHNEN